MQRGGYTYIMTNADKTVLYIGVTSNLERRVLEHKRGVYPDSFSARYKCCILVWYECFERIETAISREKQIKGGSRKRKERLITSVNPDWLDLYDEISGCFMDLLNRFSH